MELAIYHTDSQRKVLSESAKIFVLRPTFTNATFTKVQKPPRQEWIESVPLVRLKILNMELILMFENCTLIYFLVSNLKKTLLMLGFECATFHFDTL